MSIQAPAIPTTLTFSTTGAAGYCTGQTLIQEINNAVIVSTTNGAMISFDGGTTDGMAVAQDHPHEPEGMKLPKGTVIACKDLTAGSHYGKVVVSGWKNFRD